MKRTLLIERVMDQTRLAVIEDGRLCELCVQRPDAQNLTGNLYLGRVANVVPGIGAAFVDIGQPKNGFLSADDMPGADPTVRGADRLPKPGQAVLVQVSKAQSGVKGPRLTAKVALTGRLLALLPNEHSVGVSKKIDDEAERERLRSVGQSVCGANGAGLILRTAAEGADAAAIAAEYGRLSALWGELQSRAAHAVAPKQLHDDNALTLRAVRDRLTDDVDALWVDDAACYEEARALAQALAPEQAGKVRLHGGDAPLFDLYRVDAQADAALNKFVWLKGGGSLVIEETEALTVVDVNTAKNTGRRDADETLFENNCEAAREVMRQLRLRDIGGIVVIDFIDMDSPARREALLDVLRECAARDSVRVNVVGITGLGLVELTRKKARQSLSRQLLHTCSVCGGNGTVPSHETTARRAVRDIWRKRRGGATGALLVEAEPKVCGWIETIGAPPGGPVWVRPVESVAAGEYAISPADAATLPPGSKLLK